MKKNYPLNILYLFLGIFLFSLPLSAQVYVDQDATGSNDGSSWANAYTTLEDALANTTTGSIWVAEGLYKPGGNTPDSSSTFRISGAIQLYGGFDGTETSLAERNFLVNGTALSGDIMGDDVQGNFDDNKSDNVQHVIVVDSMLSIVTIDGFLLEGGMTSDYDDQNEFFYKGGAVYAYSPISLSNCQISDNFGRSGAGVYLSPEGGGSSGSSFNNLSFQFNQTSAQSAGIHAREVSDISITQCEFRNNVTVRGAFYPLDCDNVLIDNCLFEDNTPLTTTGFGGVFFNWQSTGVTISNTMFNNNSAGNGGCIYNDGRETIGMVDASNLVIDNCTFTNNSAMDWGGGVIYSWRASLTINDCLFDANIAPNTGAHAYFGGDDKNVVITNTTFEDGTATFGGAHACYGGNSIFTLTNNHYENGVASTSGGAISSGFLAQVTVDNCSFMSNMASFGGAIHAQNDTTEVTVMNSEFIGNDATDNGGAVNLSGAITFSADKCTFQSNMADFGGAISGSEFDAASELTVSIKDSRILFNFCNTQGAGINLVDADATITSTALLNNINQGTGAGGAISNNATDTNSVVLNIINSTIANNQGELGAGIAQFTEVNESFAEINLQNTLLFNSGTNYEIEDGTPTINSLGGNLISDNTLMDVATNTNDQSSVPFDGQFVNPIIADFHLVPESAAINAGIADNAPEFDIEGNPRDGAVDSGAYEYQSTVSTQELIENEGQFSIFPNPAVNDANLKLENDWKGRLTVLVFNLRGEMVLMQQIEKVASVQTFPLNVQKLSTGLYEVAISNGTQLIVQPLEKY